MDDFLSRGNICFKDKQNITYNVCSLSYELNENGTFKYSFKPNYNVIRLLEGEDFGGIPGLNLDLKKSEYVRTIIPVFISERVPQKNREGYDEILMKMGMSFMDPILYLIKTDEHYCGDTLFVKEYKEKRTVNVNNELIKCNSYGTIKFILDNIALGNDIEFPDFLINNENSYSVFKTLLFIYRKMNVVRKEAHDLGVEKAKQNKAYKGRKPIMVNPLRFEELQQLVNKKELTNIEAAKKMGISIDKYYRVKKEISK